MSAPSAEHERRRAILDALAVLGGFATEARFPLLRPDVHRRRRSDGAWFVGEAKASEGPGDSDAVGRLGRYVEVCGACGATALIALAVAPQHVRRWQGWLDELLGGDQTVRASISGQSGLVWAWYSPADGQSARTGHSGHLGLNGRQTSRPCWSAFT